MYYCSMSFLEDKQPKRTPISSMGEFGLIEALTTNFESKNQSTVLAIGDDAAVIDTPKNYHLLSTDMMVEGIHFDLSYTPLKHLGYKAVAVNVSDICAMNGKARQITLSIAVSNRFPLEALEELYIGVRAACKKFNVDLVGGDTTSSQSGLVLSLSVLGEVPKGKIVYRSGAKENDLLVVTGDLGGAYLGLQVLSREKQVFEANPNVQPDLEGKDYLLERQLKPEARNDIIEILEEKKIIPTSMIDVSDGLSSEALHLCKNSNVGCAIYEDKIPIDYTAISVAEELNLSAATCALNGGEDYELLFTIQQKDYDKLKKDPDFTVIGHITDISSGKTLIAQDGSVHTLTAQGWDAL